MELEKIKKWLGAGSINIFGRPFSGKDTQGHKLAELFNARLFGGGELFRSLSSEEIERLNITGELFPSDIYMNYVLPHLRKGDATKPLLLSAVGRRHGEAESIIEATAVSGHPMKAVILLDISEDEVWRRWEAAHKVGDRGRRSDDAHGALEVRLNEFKEKTLPVIDYYKKNSLLIKVNGEQSQAKVTKDILHALTQMANSS